MFSRVLSGSRSTLKVPQLPMPSTRGFLTKIKSFQWLQTKGMSIKLPNGLRSTGLGQVGRRLMSTEAPKVGFFRSDTWTKTVGTIGAIANWGIPLAAIAHATSDKDPLTTIDPKMTTALCIYSIFFMRWAIAISPANYPLFICHFSNELVQCYQLYRHIAARMNAKTE